MSRHVIETLNWVCHGTNQRLGFAQQQRFSDFLHGPGLHALDAIFERLSPSDEVWRIEQLNIDLGEISATTDFEGMAERLGGVLETELLRLRQNNPLDPLAPHSRARPRAEIEGELDNFLYYLVHGRLHWSMPTMGRGDMANWLERLALRSGPALWQALQRLPHADRSLHRLGHITPCHGLQALLAQRHPELVETLDTLDDTLLEPLRAHGQLSAYQIAQVRQAWRVAGLYALWGQGGSALGLARVRRLLGALGDALISQLGQGLGGDRRTLLAQASTLTTPSALAGSLLFGLQLRLFGAPQGLDSATAVGTNAGQDAAEVEGHRPYMLAAGWHESLRQFALAHRAAPAVRAAALGLSELQAYLLDYSMAYLATVDRAPQDHVAWQRLWERALGVLAGSPGNVEAAAMGGYASGEGMHVSTEMPERPHIKSKRNSAGTISPADDHPDNEAIYIVNAGLVLLANYAPRLFAMLGLVCAGEFVDKRAQRHAVHCLAYLTDGHTDSEEHEWVLNKLLCGMPIDEVVPPSKGMDDVKPILDDLLMAVISHWSALGQTTPAGLQKTYLRRLGCLVEHEALEGEHWRLKMQPGPFDVLLDQLPWGYGTIKLPWMKGAIHVDWR